MDPTISWTVLTLRVFKLEEFMTVHTLMTGAANEQC